MVELETVCTYSAIVGTYSEEEVRCVHVPYLLYGDFHTFQYVLVVGLLCMIIYVYLF